MQFRFEALYEVVKQRSAKLGRRSASVPPRASFVFILVHSPPQSSSFTPSVILAYPLRSLGQLRRRREASAARLATTRTSGSLTHPPQSHLASSPAMATGAHLILLSRVTVLCPPTRKDADEKEAFSYCFSTTESTENCKLSDFSAKHCDTDMVSNKPVNERQHADNPLTMLITRY